MGPMKASEISIKHSSGGAGGSSTGKKNQNHCEKPCFVRAKDDTKPVLQDPILRSDPIETEEAMLRLPAFPNYEIRKQFK